MNRAVVIVGFVLVIGVGVYLFKDTLFGTKESQPNTGGTDGTGSTGSTDGTGNTGNTGGTGGTGNTGGTNVTTEQSVKADFSANKTTAKEGEQINFTNNSVNATGFEWDFGDGTKSTQKNPNHIFTKKGDYNVKLTAKNNTNQNITTLKISITSLYQTEDELMQSAIDYVLNRSISYIDYWKTLTFASPNRCLVPQNNDDLIKWSTKGMNLTEQNLFLKNLSDLKKLINKAKRKRIYDRALQNGKTLEMQITYEIGLESDPTNYLLTCETIKNLFKN